MCLRPEEYTTGDKSLVLANPNHFIRSKHPSITSNPQVFIKMAINSNVMVFSVEQYRPALTIANSCITVIYLQFIFWL